MAPLNPGSQRQVPSENGEQPPCPEPRPLTPKFWKLLTPTQKKWIDPPQDLGAPLHSLGFHLVSVRIRSIETPKIDYFIGPYFFCVVQTFGPSRHETSSKVKNIQIVDRRKKPCMLELISLSYCILSTCNI
uniref:Uncharacterized protein n=1 Tax=Romanomermis culicivorax TaxID=13658 RepID=A0A915L039_ROMCU